LKIKNFKKVEKFNPWVKKILGKANPKPSWLKFLEPIKPIPFPKGS